MKRADIIAGSPGHSRELVISFRLEYDPIPAAICEEIIEECPADWFIQSRSTRIEVHPSGAFEGGYEQGDIELLRKALVRLGYQVEVYGQ